MGFKKSKTPSDIARFLGQLRNYIYRNNLQSEKEKAESFLTLPFPLPGISTVLTSFF
jgi:hypothetical protein